MDEIEMAKFYGRTEEIVRFYANDLSEIVDDTIPAEEKFLSCGLQLTEA